MQETEITILQKLADYGVGMLAFAFMMWYLMRTVEAKDKQNEAKDKQNQENLNRFISLQEESNKIHAQTAETLRNVSSQITDLHGYIREGKMCIHRKNNNS